MQIAFDNSPSVVNSRHCHRSCRSSSHSSSRRSHHHHTSRTRSHTRSKHHFYYSTSSSSAGKYSPLQSDSPPPWVSAGGLQQVLVKGAVKLNIPISIITPSTSVIFEMHQNRSASRPLLPVIPGLLEPAMELFLTPASAKPAPSRLQTKYRPPMQDPLFLRSDPPPDSVVILAGKKHHATTPSSTVPPDKESKNLDSVATRYAVKLQPL